MTEHRLHFCLIRVLDSDLFDVNVDEGVEFTPQLVDEMHNAFSVLAKGGKYAVLVHKVHSYSYTFEAQRRIFNQVGLVALAFYAPESPQRMAIESLLEVSRSESRVPIQTFIDPAVAIAWLREQLAAAGGPSQQR